MNDKKIASLLLSEIRKGLDQLDFDHFAREHGISLERTIRVSEKLMVHLFVRAATDGVVSESELTKLKKVQTVLNISDLRFDLLYKLGKSQVITTAQKKAEADGIVTEEEEEELKRLRESLGVSPPGPNSQFKLFKDKEREAKIAEKSRFLKFYSFIWSIAALTIIVPSSIYQASLSGPEFMVIFRCLCLGLCIIVALIRFSVWLLGEAGIETDQSMMRLSTHALIISILIGEGVGLFRIGYGLTQGMTHFQDLVMILCIGPVAIGAIAFADSIEISFGGGGGYDSGGGGCGGGGGGCGGGGGGCGGCGGN